MANKTYGRYLYGLEDIKIANMAGTVADLNAAQTAEVAIRTSNNILRGDDVDKASVSFPDGGEIKFKAGGYSSEAMSFMTGLTLTVGSSTPTETTELQVNAGTGFPYFKVYAKIKGDNAAGLLDDMHILCYKVKLSEGFALGFADGEFAAPEFTAQLFDDGTHGLLEIIQHETGTALPTT